MNDIQWATYVLKQEIRANAYKTRKSL